MQIEVSGAGQAVAQGFRTSRLIRLKDGKSESLRAGERAIQAAKRMLLAQMGTMRKSPAITCLILDIGGVLLTDGWSRDSRKQAVKRFELESVELENRHHLTWDTHQQGRLTLAEYLSRVIFYQKRSFTRAQFQRFMFAQSRPYRDMIQLVAQLKLQHGLKVAVVSNEGRELNAYRIRSFKLDVLVHFFISSCFVHLLKPDADIFRLALDIGQTTARQTIYIENTPMYVDIAEGLGIRSILHADFKSTRAKLASFGLQISEPVIHEGS